MSLLPQSAHQDTLTPSPAGVDAGTPEPSRGPRDQRVSEDTREPGQTFDPGHTREPGQAFDPGHTRDPGRTLDPQDTRDRGVTLSPGPDRSELWGDLRPGLAFHQYELIRELGSGGVGRVFLARDKKLARRVAIKILHRGSAAFNARFMEEARSTARCNHENIVVIHDVNELAGQPFLVLEHLEGQPLDRMLPQGQTVPPARAVQLVAPLVRALVHAHGLGLVHRDLKPGNVFVCSSGVVKVLDFGLATATAGDLRARIDSFDDEAGAPGRRVGPVGTPSFMAPEQWGEGPVDHRADLFGVGLILYRLVAGQQPLEKLASDELEREASDLDAPLPGVGTTARELPLDLERLIDRCIAKRPEDRFVDAQALLRALSPLLPRRTLNPAEGDECPFPGLLPFQEEDADRFHGRTRETTRALHALESHALVAVAGPSGVGKSSFVRAGLIPALRATGERWEVTTIRPGPRPLHALGAMLLALEKGQNATSTQAHPEQETLATLLLREPGTLGARLRALAAHRGCRLLLHVDQAEELYALVGDPLARLAFTACLRGVCDDPSSPLRVVLSMRSDFLDRAAEDEAFVELVTRGLLFLPLLDRESLRQAIVAPLDSTGFGFDEPDIVEEMLETLGETSSSLPLLQFTMSKLWERRDQRSARLTRAAYEALGGVGGAFATHAEAVLSALPGDDLRLVRGLFQRLVTPDGTRALVGALELRELSADGARVQRLLDYLMEARLLDVHTQGGEGLVQVELVHESLIRSWPLLGRWLEEGHEHAAFLGQLRHTARQWVVKGRPMGLLWRGEAMEEARRFAARYDGPLAALEREYLDAVDSLATRAVRRKRALAGAVFAFLVLLIAAGAVTIYRVRSAEQEAQDKAQMAKREARRARDAEGRVTRQISLLRKEQEAKQLAEEQARAARTEAQTRGVRLLSTETELQGSREELLRVLARVRAEKARAEQALALAREAQKKAENATGEVRRIAEEQRKAKESYLQLLLREQARVQELLRQRRKIELELK